MNLKKSVLGILVTLVLSNVLTTVWYMVSDDANFVSFRREEINYLGLVLNHLVYAALFVYLFPLLLRSGKSEGMGPSFLFGVALSALMFIPSGMVVRSIWTVDFNAIFVMNSLAHLVIGGILGLVLRFIYNYKKEA